MLAKSLFRVAWIAPFIYAACACPQEPGLQSYELIDQYLAANGGRTGVYILEKGEESLRGRAWLTDNARKSIDIQYFIWSTDNIGILASQKLLAAAERGVTVRVLVDDLLIDANDEVMLALASHPNVSIRIYNPVHSVGISVWQKLLTLITDFRLSNQRMHNKVALFDNTIAITGGRNMADEYYDFDHAYNFRDRDVLLVGNVVSEMGRMFEDYWRSPLAVPVESQLKDGAPGITPAVVRKIYDDLHAYADNPENFLPGIRGAISDIGNIIPELLQQLALSDVDFIYDRPGKNPGTSGLGGGGDATTALLNELLKANRSVVIQSPYLVMSDDVLEIFRQLVSQGIEVRISTNSLSSTDNLMAYSGYDRNKQDLMDAGLKISEFRPDPGITTELMGFIRAGGALPTFAIHAKTMVIDESVVYVGTFNLDPRSINLNTEVGVIVRNPAIAKNVRDAILRDMDARNSWDPAGENTNAYAPMMKRFKLFLYKLLPLEPVL